MSIAWRTMATAPQDGTVIWAWLYDTGIRKVRWESPEEAATREGGDAEDYDGEWVEEGDADEVWGPKFWLPLDAIPVPLEPE